MGCGSATPFLPFIECVGRDFVGRQRVTKRVSDLAENRLLSHLTIIVSVLQYNLCYLFVPKEL